MCCLCRARAETRHHLLLECPTVGALWDRLSVAALIPLVNEPVDQWEMCLAKAAPSAVWKLRNRLGFTLRSAIHSMRFVQFENGDIAQNSIWNSFLHRLKNDMMEDYYTAKLGGTLALFEARILIGGVLGRMDGEKVRWAGILYGVAHEYWSLYS